MYKFNIKMIAYVILWGRQEYVAYLLIKSKYQRNVQLDLRKTKWTFLRFSEKNTS